MKKIAAIIVVLLGVVLAVGACSGSTSVAGPSGTGTSDTQKPSGQAIKATWITPQATGDTLFVTVTEVNNDTNVHFYEGPAQGNKMAFMAYNLEGKLYVRANICPPCGSIGFSLVKDTLVCDTCKTVFNAKTGVGISGGCVNYPKAAVPYEISNGNIVMKVSDLQVAYENTLKAGLP